MKIYPSISLIKPYKNHKLCLKITYLNEQILEELLVSILIAVHLLSDLSSHGLSKVFNELVDLSHLLNSFHVLLLGLLDLQSDLLIGQFILVVFGDLLFFFLYVVVLLNGELVTHALLDSRDFLFTMLLDESNHGIEDLLGLNHIHLYIFRNEIK